MELSKRKRRWISIFVGVVGLVTVVGLSDLIFVIPQQQTVDQAPVVTEPTVVATQTPVVAPPVSSTTPATIATSTPLGSPNEFGL